MELQIKDKIFRYDFSGLITCMDLQAIVFN